MQQKIFKLFLLHGMLQKEIITVKNILARFLGHLPIFEALA
jgi:hypothetical protein